MLIIKDYIFKSVFAFINLKIAYKNIFILTYFFIIIKFGQAFKYNNAKVDNDNFIYYDFDFN